MSEKRAICFTLIVRKPNGEVYREIDERWIETDYFCPCCGEQGMCKEDGGGDYYEGSRYLCPSCRATSQLGSVRPFVEDAVELDTQRSVLINKVTGRALKEK